MLFQWIIIVRAPRGAQSTQHRSWGTSWEADSSGWLTSGNRHFYSQTCIENSFRLLFQLKERQRQGRKIVCNATGSRKPKHAQFYSTEPAKCKRRIYLESLRAWEEIGAQRASSWLPSVCLTKLIVYYVRSIVTLRFNS